MGMSAKSDAAWRNLGSEGGNLSVSDFISVKVTALSTLLHRRLTKLYLADHDIGLSEWRMLTLLVDRTPISAVDVNSHSGMDKAQISRALELLSQKKMVERVRDPSDGRRQVLFLTKRGRQIFDKIMRDAQKRQAALIGELTLQERADFLRLLERIGTIAKTVVPEDDAEVELEDTVQMKAPPKARASKRP